MPPFLPRALAFTLLAALPPAFYSFHLYRRLSPISSLSIHSSDSIAASFATSPTVTAIANPAGHPAGTDSRSVFLPSSYLPLGPSGRPLSDQQVLAKLVHGFFGGRVIAPERWALWLAKWCGGGPMLKIRMLDEGGPMEGAELWTEKEIRELEEWKLGTRVVGAFQVADMKVAEALDGGDGKERESYIDFVFGADAGFLRGVHRFSVLRSRQTAGGVAKADEQERCELRIAHLACDPKKNEPLKPEWLQTFHSVYAMLLFRESVAEVLAPVR